MKAANEYVAPTSEQTTSCLPQHSMAPYDRAAALCGALRSAALPAHPVPRSSHVSLVSGSGAAAGGAAGGAPPSCSFTHAHHPPPSSPAWAAVACPVRDPHQGCRGPALKSLEGSLPLRASPRSTWPENKTQAPEPRPRVIPIAQRQGLQASIRGADTYGNARSSAVAPALLLSKPVLQTL